MDKLRLAWKYGTFNLIKLERFYQSILADFLKIYKSLKEGKGFKTMEEVLNEMNPNFDELTQTPLANHLSEEVGLPDPLIEDIVSAATKFNYGQLPSEMPAFVGAVALIGFDKQLWAVEGGNVRVAECALRLSGAKLERRRVGEITKEEDGRYRIDSSDELYDVIIIATPLTADTSDLWVDGERMVVPGSYHRTVATLVQAELNVSADLAAIIGTKKGEKISRPQVNRNSFAMMYISYVHRIMLLLTSQGINLNVKRFNNLFQADFLVPVYIMYASYVTT